MSQVGFGPLERIDGPPPVAPVYGLLQAASAPAQGVRIVTDADAGPDAADIASVRDILPPLPGQERWLNGVEVYPYPVDTGGTFDTCTEGSGDTKGFGTTPPRPQFGALTIYLAESCNPASLPDADAWKSRATATLAAVESSIVAREFLTGARLPLNPHLSDGLGTFPAHDIPTSVVHGISLLEAEIARSGRQGVIHCSPQAATMARDRFILDNRSGVLRTINGVVVIPDFGYVDGATPHGHTAAAANQEWIYATGPIDVRRSEMFTMPDDLAEAVDRGLGATNGTPNLVTWRAERYYLVDWDTVVQAAVLVDLCSNTVC